jgi:thymidylate kinase
LSYNHINTRLSIQTLERLHDRANAHQIPAISILLDVPVDVALKRIFNRHRRSRFDVLPRIFLKAQSDIFEHLAATLPNWIVVDGSLKEDEVTSRILNKMSKIKVK